MKKLDWREYIHSDNPVAAALLSKMGFRPEERVRVKLEFLRMLARMKLDPARMELLAVFFETYLKLNREEEEQLYRELGKMDKKEVDAIMQITTSWHEKGRAEGRAEGRVEGRVEKAREIICKYLSRKFGDKSAGLQQKVWRMTDLETLDYILEQLFAASTLEEARVIINNGVRER
ncbi:hypothetical protein [Desulfofundulus sp. TPOSR]|uniref:hypothetical protein n=1 Tax=Desulfofundulus sp. TPOSR TaxID=2714340 RepID=UPI0028BDC329|nr:hypothetical protein [Desulfofundulus sp. TPOSR]